MHMHVFAHRTYKYRFMGGRRTVSFILCPLTLAPIPMPHNSTVGDKIPSSLSPPFTVRLFLSTEDIFFLTFDHAVYSISMNNLKNSLTEQVLI